MKTSPAARVQLSASRRSPSRPSGDLRDAAGTAGVPAADAAETTGGRGEDVSKERRRARGRLEPGPAQGGLKAGEQSLCSERHTRGAVCRGSGKSSVLVILIRSV